MAEHDQGMIVIENDKLIVKVTICGREITEKDASLKSSANILLNFDSGLRKCLKRASMVMAKPETILPPIPPIRLRSATKGSLDFSTVIDLAGYAATAYSVAPAQVVKYGIDLFKNAGNLIAMADELFSQKGTTMPIHVENSPGAVILVAANGGQIQTDQNTLFTARQIHKELNKIANEVAAGQADIVKIGREQDITPLLVDHKNKGFFKVPSIEKTDDNPIKLKCDIYSLDKHKRKGWLQLLEVEDPRPIPFELIGEGEVVDFIEGMKSEYSLVEAYREMSVNTLGETKLKKLLVTSIEIKPLS